MTMPEGVVDVILQHVAEVVCSGERGLGISVASVQKIQSLLMQNRMPTALLPDGRLACGTCGNADRATLRLCEFVQRTWQLPPKADEETDDTGPLVITADDQINWETSDDVERLLCLRCCTESRLPPGMAIEWV